MMDRMKIFGKNLGRTEVNIGTLSEQKKSPYLQSLVKYGVPTSKCCGGRTRTDDLWVMSPTSYHCSTPRYIFLVLANFSFYYSNRRPLISGCEPNDPLTSGSTPRYIFLVLANFSFYYSNRRPLTSGYEPNDPLTSGSTPRCILCY